MIRKPDGRVETTFMGRKRKLKKEEEVEKLKEQMANAGQYGVEMTQDEYDLYVQDPSLIGELFQRALYERVQEWARLADERLSGQEVRCFVSPGNDDDFIIDEALAKAENIEVHDGRVVELGDGFQMIGVGYANVTPWNCPRDITEEELAEKIEGLAAKIARMDRAVFDIHVPPYDTGIDEAPELTEDKQVVTDGVGAPIMTPVGSTAVREAILRHEPLLGLHGHIHESAGIRRLGGTTVINPGSEYGEGLLRGALIEVNEKEGLVGANLVTG
jgi:Icc-related predicted phosphoesterase